MNDFGIQLVIGALIVLVVVWIAYRYLLPWLRNIYSLKRVLLLGLLGFVVANALVPQIISRDSVFLAAMVVAFAQFIVGGSTRGKDFGSLVTVAVVNVTYGSNLFLVLALSIWEIFWTWVDSTSEPHAPKKVKQSKAQPRQAENAQRTNSVRAFLDRLNRKEQVDDEIVDFDEADEGVNPNDNVTIDVKTLKTVLEKMVEERLALAAAANSNPRPAPFSSPQPQPRPTAPATPAQPQPQPRPTAPATPAQPQPQPRPTAPATPAQPQPRPTAPATPAQPQPQPRPTAPATPLPWDDIEASDDPFDEDPFAEFDTEFNPPAPFSTTSQAPVIPTAGSTPDTGTESQPPFVDFDFEQEEWLGNPFPDDEFDEDSTTRESRKSKSNRSAQRRREQRNRSRR